jgi:hypothetical protein
MRSSGSVKIHFKIFFLSFYVGLVQVCQMFKCTTRYATNALPCHTYGLLEVYSINLYHFLFVLFNWYSTSSGKVWYSFLKSFEYVILNIDCSYHVHANDPHFLYNYLNEDPFTSANGVQPVGVKLVVF